MKANNSNNYEENSKKMKTLKNPNDVIEIGVFAGETLRSFLKNYGKKYFPVLLKYYNLSDEIMREYHCHLEPHKERTKAEVSVQDNIIDNNNAENNMVDTKEVDQVDLEVDDALNNASDLVELDDKKWTSSLSDYENSALYDPEDDMADSYYYDRIMRSQGMALHQEIANI